MRIAIIGAGIMGVTTAVRLLELYPDSKITIFTDQFSPNTTSDVSAGFWKPYCLDDDESLIRKWGKETYYRMINDALSEDAYKLGVQILPAYVLNNCEETQIPFWSKDVEQFRVLKKSEIASICASDEIKSGIHFTTTTVTINKYIPFLLNKLKSKGVIVIQKKINKLNEFINENQNKEYDYIVNCVGLGALEFCDDTAMHPVRGQVMRVKAPWMNACIILEHEVTYILPLTDVVVLGGTQEPGSFNQETKINQCDGILERCSKLYPSLKDATILERKAGLRPLRKGGVKLGMQAYQKSNGQLSKVIHNYGHGGSGITLCWGCATNVCDIIKSDNKKLKSNL